MRLKVKEAEAEASNWKEEKDIQAKESVQLLKKVSHARVFEEVAKGQFTVQRSWEGCHESRRC